MSALLVVLSVSLVSGAASAKPKLTASKFRKAKNGVGNCIFATSALPFEEEKSYAGITAKFKTGDTPYARCYFAKKLGDFGKPGKLMNELRDERTYRISLQTREKTRPAPRHKVQSAGASLPTSTVRVKQDGEEEWDQREYDLDPSKKRCLFKSHLGTDGCLDWDRAAQEIAMLAGKKAGDVTVEFCMRTFVEYADEQTGQAGSSAVELVRKTDVVAEGCFEWTTTVTPKEEPPPEGAAVETK